MGQAESSRGPQQQKGSVSSDVLLLMDQYPVKLTPAQCSTLYGPFNSKACILRWSDVVERPSLTFRKCVQAKVQIPKLYNMQRDLQQWIRHGKVLLEDCPDLAPWGPHPFLDFQCHIGDLVVRKQAVTHAVLVRGAVTFDQLWERFGLTPALMGMIGFTPEQWLELGLRQQHVEAIGDADWEVIFKGRSRQWVMEELQHKHKHNKHKQQAH